MGNDKPGKHSKAFTYEPKIKKVRSGEITQTIRVKGKRPVKVGDKISFHGWQGRPYWTAWSWRMPYMEVIHVRDIMIVEAGIAFKGGFYSAIFDWNSPFANDLAMQDGIVPEGDESPAIAMKNLFKKMGAFKTLKTYQIIRWRFENGGQ